MLAPGEAVEKARGYLGEVVPEFAAMNPKVEEMVLTPDSSEWKITFYVYSGDPNAKVTSLADLMRPRKIEKVVSIAQKDGTLIAVRNPPPF
jgi:hypothetical protein